MLEDKVDSHASVVDKYHSPGANYQMTVRDYVLRPRASVSSGAITITLPPVAEAKGRFYSIMARQANPVLTITIEDKDDSECWEGDIVFNGKCDRALMYSDGLSWYNLKAEYSPGTTIVPTTEAL
jgi:hypothetical protein